MPVNKKRFKAYQAAEQRRMWVRFSMYKCDNLNLHKLTLKLTSHSKPSRAATLHALLRAACQQHGIEPFEPEDVFDPASFPEYKATKEFKSRGDLRKERLEEIEGKQALDLHVKL